MANCIILWLFKMSAGKAPMEGNNLKSSYNASLNNVHQKHLRGRWKALSHRVFAPTFKVTFPSDGHQVPSHVWL